MTGHVLPLFFVKEQNFYRTFPDFKTVEKCFIQWGFKMELFYYKLTENVEKTVTKNDYDDTEIYLRDNVKFLVQGSGSAFTIFVQCVSKC